MTAWFWGSKTFFATATRVLFTPVAYPFLFVGWAVTACFNPDAGKWISVAGYWRGEAVNLA